jgi:hypothetical protein
MCVCVCNASPMSGQKGKTSHSTSTVEIKYTVHPPDVVVVVVAVVRGCPTKAATGPTTTDSATIEDWNFMIYYYGFLIGMGRVVYLGRGREDTTELCVYLVVFGRSVFSFFKKSGKTVGRMNEGRLCK